MTSPLLIENGLHSGMDGVVLVWVPREVQKARLMARDGLDEAAAEARLAAQLPLDDKRPHATWIVDNSGELDATRAQVRASLAGHARARLSAGYAAPPMSEKRKKAERTGPGRTSSPATPGFIGKRLVEHIAREDPQGRIYALVQPKFLKDAQEHAARLEGAQRGAAHRRRGGHAPRPVRRGVPAAVRAR